ncbi:hypothetical protein TRFO_37768 [Tritrichomonas foetus]|uniref:Uncharacterized protein n=1 Tax=Tritrichomonas foetus TaxID=1144522 RepID=A0A1J4JBR4_9EUKA|nr:hypothetical protein TRFO_37768 [Tritrichomonas foetus]|eukprot:OHS96097.1 hypothetical protein TRFO_37768 [Tritrichomonas foetus]
MNSNYSNLSVPELVANLQNAERVIEGQKKLLLAKDRLIQSTTDQYNELLADYQSLLASSYQGQSQQPQQNFRQPMQNNNNNFDDYSLQQNNRYNNTFCEPAPHETFPTPRGSPPPMNQNCANQNIYDQNPSQMNNMQVNNQSNQNENEIPYSKRALMSSIKFGADDDVQPGGQVMTSIKLAQERKAMDDSLWEPLPADQGHSSIPPSLLIDVSGMTIDQMRSKVDELNIEKAAIERQLNKAMPKGKIMSHAIKEREELERKFEEMNKMISHVKLAIRNYNK